MAGTLVLLTDRGLLFDTMRSLGNGGDAGDRE